MALLLRAAARQGVPTSKVPDDFIMTCSDVQFEAALEEQLTEDGSANLQSWERVAVTIGQGSKERVVKKVQLVDKRLDKSQFITLVTSELRKFRQQRHRVAQQYGAVKKLKEKLPPNHIT